MLKHVRARMLGEEFLQSRRRVGEFTSYRPTSLLIRSTSSKQRTELRSDRNGRNLEVSDDRWAGDRGKLRPEVGIGA